MEIRNLSARISNAVSILKTHGVLGTYTRVFEKYLSPIVNKNHVRLARVAVGRKLERILGSPLVR